MYEVLNFAEFEVIGETKVGIQKEETMKLRCKENLIRWREKVF